MKIALKRIGIPLLGLLLLALWSPETHAADKIVFGFKGNQAELVLAQELVEEFNQSQNEIIVEVLDMTARGGAWHEHLSVLFASGEAPDVIRMEYQRGFPFAKEGLLRPIDDLIASDPNFVESDFFPVSLEAHRVDGRQYGVPREAQPFTLFVNRTAVSEAGLGFPDHDWDIREFEDIVRRTVRTDHSGKTLHYGWQLTVTETRLPPFIHAFGGRILNEDRTAFVLDAPEVIDALQFMQDLSVNHGAIGGNFQQGTATFELSGPWAVPGYRNAIQDSFEWDILPVPQGPGGRGTTLGSDAYYISNQSRNPELAWRFITFITSAESLARLSETGALVPSRRDVAFDLVFGTPVGPPQNLGAYLTGLEFAQPSPMFSRWFDFARTINPVWSSVIQGNADPRTAMTEILPELNALLSE